MIIRDAIASDLPALIALWQACGLTRPWNDPTFDASRALEHPTSTILVLEQGGTITGSVMVGDDGHRGWMYYLASSPGRRGQGIGRKLVAAAEDWLRERGCPKVELLVRDGNLAALGFYERIGYEEQAVTVKARWLNGQDGTGSSRR
ncbi:MAG: GNAT family acetyltransferase [Pseudomonadota bacterium]|nr:GNAT family acetyltransferase [Pseudomonadota bacterium]